MALRFSVLAHNPLPAGRGSAIAVPMLAGVAPRHLVACAAGPVPTRSRRAAPGGTTIHGYRARNGYRRAVRGLRPASTLGGRRGRTAPLALHRARLPQLRYAAPRIS